MMHLKILTVVSKVVEDRYRYKIRIFPQAVILVRLNVVAHLTLCDSLHLTQVVGLVCCCDIDLRISLII